MMSEFDNLRQQLAAARAQQENARQSSAAAQERIDRLKREITALERRLDPHNGQQREQLDALEAQLKRAQSTAERSKRGLLELNAAASGIYTQFHPFTDPRQMIGQFQDRYPIFMMPLRIETRFKTIATAGAAPRQQLWVRVYPDDCWLDRFEPVLAEAEIINARLFWQGIWAAAGDDTLERAAWRGLVAASGSGRSAWIVQSYQPENMAEQPQRDADSDVVLVVASDAPFTPAEKFAITTYWTAIWLTDGEAVASQNAFDALVGSVGLARAETIRSDHQPFNLSAVPAAPLTKAEVGVKVGFIDWPPPATVETKARSWSQAARVNILPERLVVLGYRGSLETPVIEHLGNPIPSPLVAGPDPSAAENEQLRPDFDSGDLIVPDEMQWMMDFERAVAVGMGFRIDLTPELARAGFDRLIVMGVRLSADAQEGQGLVENLFTHHHYSRQGFSLIPQGTPTNNTEKEGAGFSRGDDPERTFDTHFKRSRAYTPQTDAALRQDGEWLADYLGLTPAVVQQWAGSDLTDQLEARAMNTALWSGTYGYMLDTMLTPIVPQTEISATRSFFNQFVSGRGALPALRIGAQPYGILPTTAYSRMGWFRRGVGATTGVAVNRVGSPFLARLYGLLQKIDTTWSELANAVPFVGKAGDAHRNLLDVVGLHSGSVEYHQRYAESIEHLYNTMNIFGLGGQFFAALIAGAYIQSGKNLLAELGYTGDETPDIVEKLFLSNQHKMQGPVVDDRPLSETEPLRVYTPDNRNYLQWLIDAANTSLETLRRQSGFTDNKAPNALLYILLRYSLMQSYWETSIRLFRLAEVFDDNRVAQLRRQPTFLHVKAQAEQSESRFAQLYTPSAAITGSDTMLVADHITRLIPRRDSTPQAIATAELYEQLAALEHLKDLPTARLERLFAEHIDLCSYRLDAWMQGFVNLQLSLMRYQRRDDNPETDDVQRGLYIGAYGWVENLRPENKQLTPVALQGELQKIFNSDPKAPPLMRDSTNGGYIHAPSLNHAVTAAVLRNGYLANATPANPDTLAVNLSSDRVRRALWAIEGIRAGQSLGALLGYQFERGLHDRHNEAEVDSFIYDLRKAFPLQARRLRQTAEPEDTSIEALEARNVMDGLKLVEHIRATNNRTYPFGKTLPDASDTQEIAINAEVERLLDTHDAVADVAVAESVHQAAMGNYDRAAGTLDTYSKGNFPPIPDVIQTPRSGIAITQRVGLHLPIVANPALSPIPGLSSTPRSQAEAALNQWLAAILPDPATVACTVTIRHPVTAAETSVTVSQFDLGLQPLDLLYLLPNETAAGMTELDDRVMRQALAVATPRADATCAINYMQAGANPLSFFQLIPLVESLRQLALASRPLLPSDVRLHNEAASADDETVSLDVSRITTAQANLTALRADVQTYGDALQAWFDDLPTHQPDIIAAIQTLSDDLINLLERASRAAIPQTGWGFIYERRGSIYRRLLAQVQTLVDRWTQRLDAFTAALNDFDALPPPTPDEIEDRFKRLIQAEQLITTLPTNPLPPTPDAFRLALPIQQAAFTAKRDAFAALRSTTLDLPDLLAAAQALLPITGFDFEPFTFDAITAEILLLADDLLGSAAGLITDIDSRMAAAQAQLDRHAAATKPSEQVAALQDAARALFGQDFRLIPTFNLSPAQASEWQNAFNDSDTLLTYVRDTLGIDFPMDDWLYGAARVRQKLHHWERALFLSEGFGTSAPTLRPIQLPYQADDRWLGLDYPPETVIDGDRLLYSAHYAGPFNPAAAQCGLLIDEWTEVIPGTSETTGITFHYDRPNAEPPQTMLLVTPPLFTGAWRWDDLVQSLHETLALARKRAVEPAQVDETAYARFLPATVMAVTINNLVISANLAVNNNVFQAMPGGNS